MEHYNFLATKIIAIKFGQYYWEKTTVKLWLIWKVRLIHSIKITWLLESAMSSFQQALWSSNLDKMDIMDNIIIVWAPTFGKLLSVSLNKGYGYHINLDCWILKCYISFLAMVTKIGQ